MHIGENSITDIEEINAMKDLELQELVLTRNPICKEYQSNSQMTISKTCKNGVLNSCDWMVWIFENLLCDIVDEGNNRTAFERMFVANVQAQQFTVQFS